MQMMKPEQVQDWVERASPGEDAVYCTGPRPSEAVGAAVRALHERGLVTMTSKRSGDGFRFIMQRLPTPQQRARAMKNRGHFKTRSDDAKRTTQAVFRQLARAANRGEPCPTNTELARIVGLRDSVAASYRVRCLVRDGKISVWEPSPLERRVVTIAATGAQTRRALL